MTTTDIGEVTSGRESPKLLKIYFIWKNVFDYYAFNIKISSS